MFSNFYKYYKEIKNRLVLTTIAWGFTLSVCYVYKETLLFLLINLNPCFIELHAQPYFIFTEVTEVFSVYLDLALFLTNQTGIFLLLYQMFMFLSLGLYKFEFLRVRFAFEVFIVSWGLSTVLLYNFIIPFSWSFFLSFQKNSSMVQPFSIFFETKLIEYLQYFTNMYYICFISCQFLGFLTIVLTNLNKKFKQTKIFRKLFYIIFVIFSTIITPPDVISQLCISLGLILAYEILLIIKFIRLNMATN